MQHLGGEGIVSDEHTAWFNSVRNRDAKEVKKFSVTVLLSENKLQSTSGRRKPEFGWFEI